MYSVLNGKPLEQWKVTELKEELKKRGLPVRGLKDELIKRLDFAILDEKDEKEQQEETVQNEEDDTTDKEQEELAENEEEDNIDKEQQEGTVQNEEEDTTDKEHQEETVQNEEEDNIDKEHQEGAVQNEEEDTTDKEHQEETIQNEEEDNIDKEHQEGAVQNEEEDNIDKEHQEGAVQNEEEDNTDKEQQEGAVENESVMENVENGANSETQVNENVEPVDTYHTMVVEDDWVKINKGSEGNVEPRVSNDGEVQPINTPVVEEAIHKETDSTVGKVGTPEPQISNVEEAQSVSTPITDDVRENRENTIESVEIDETMADAGLVDDTSSVMGQDVGSLSFTDSTAAIMDATDSAAVLMDATDSAAADEVVEVSVEEVVEVSVEEVVTVTQSVVTEVLVSEEELQNKETDREPEVPNHPSGDSMHSMSNQNSQVSEVSRDLGFQVRSESISTDCVSIIEKNELKDNLNADNFHIEQNVVMPEMVQPSSNDVCPDDGALRSLEGQEPCENQESMEGLDDTSATVNLDKKNDATDALLEKLNLDRSSGDESMEEDISEGKHVESIHNSDGMEEKNSLPEVNGVNKENHVGVTIESLSDKGTSAEGMISHAVPAEKRKLQDQEVGMTNEIPKRQRRWNSETLKVPEPQASTLKSGTPPKDAFPSDAPKRSVAKSGSTLSPEIARERVVPPSAKPPTTSLRIDNFLRPFTLKAVQELLAKTGAVSSFWMDHIKTHCYVMYSSVEEATETRNAVYNLQWPTNGGKLLVADFVDPQDVKTRAEAPAPAPVSTTPKTPLSAQLSSRPPPPEASPRLAVQRKQLPPPPPMTSEPPPPTKERLPLPPPPPLPQIEEPPIVTLDDLFRKTTATPRIYFLPLSEQEVSAKLARQGKNTK